LTLRLCEREQSRVALSCDVYFYGNEGARCENVRGNESAEK
jgi:hypothetical protein